MKAYTTEEINEIISNPSSGRLNLEKLKLWMITNGHRKQDKPFGMPYESELGAVVIFTDETTIFGFDGDGVWVSTITWKPLSSNSWQPYPQEKWEAMLLDYAKSRGYKNGNYKCLLQPNETYNFTGEIKFYFNPHGVWIDGDDGRNQIFDAETGEWAEIIEVPEYTWEKIKEILGHEFTIKN